MDPKALRARRIDRYGQIDSHDGSFEQDRNFGIALNRDGLPCGHGHAPSVDQIVPGTERADVFLHLVAGHIAGVLADIGEGEQFVLAFGQAELYVAT